jgi:hypothetical protein
MATIVGIGGIDVSDRQGEFFPLQPLLRGYHPLDLVLRFDPVALLLDQTAGLKTCPALRAGLTFFYTHLYTHFFIHIFLCTTSAQIAPRLRSKREIQPPRRSRRG